MPAAPTTRTLSGLAAAALLTALLAGCGGASAPSAPPRSADALRSEAGRLVGGGKSAFDRQLSTLRGTPVVVNQWAHWCGPCRFEFPFFARLAAKYHGRVAFLGVNSRDDTAGARRFLETFPVPYPSFEDPDAAIARSFRGGRNFPTTAYYDARGKLVETHQGAYASEGALEQDVRAIAQRN
jgi:thiol-disulfide isomerase/thioredoxin